MPPVRSVAPPSIGNNAPHAVTQPAVITNLVNPLSTTTGMLFHSLEVRRTSCGRLPLYRLAGASCGGSSSAIARHAAPSKSSY